ncbi:MAG: YdcF family protein [Elainellaceae cyanobacterium]
MLLTLAGLPWLIKLPFKRLVSGLCFSLLALYFFAASPLTIPLGMRGLTALTSASTGDIQADAIVVLGRGRQLQNARINAAYALWENGAAPRIFVSGRGDAPELIQKLRAKGVPEGAVDGEPCSSTTEENTQYTANILQPQGVTRIVLVTDQAHMPRSLLTFRSLGFDAVPYATPLPKTLSQAQTKFLIAREYLGLASYGALGRFSPREVASGPVDLGQSNPATAINAGSGA